MRNELTLIQDWIEPGSRVLDLACGDGSLLAMLRDQREVEGLGVEIDSDAFTACIDKGINVIEQDLNQGLDNFQSNSFDYVVMTQSLQTLRNPHQAISEMLRVGRECIVTFPNFGFWQCRLHLGLGGKMPVSRHMPYSWYDTPNIHFCTVRDFEALCQQQSIHIRHRTMLGSDDKTGPIAERWANLFAVTAVYHISA